MPSERNALYCGENLGILRLRWQDETVDLVYLDPPFNSGQNFQLLFKARNGKRSSAPIPAFEDTWRWDAAAGVAFRETIEKGGRASEALLAFRQFLGESDLLAYLSMMAPRLVELRRVLKSSGSLYLHCDPFAGHYPKILPHAAF